MRYRVHDPNIDSSPIYYKSHNCDNIYKLGLWTKELCYEAEIDSAAHA